MRAPPDQNLINSSALERELATSRRDADPAAGPEVTARDALGEWVFQLLLNRPFQRPRAIHRIESRLREAIDRGLIERQLDIALAQTTAQISQLNVDDRTQLLPAERMEHDQVVYP